MYSQERKSLIFFNFNIYSMNDKVYKFEEHTINEEFIGALVNYFKGLWKKMAAEIAKLNNDPNKIKDFIFNTTLNPTSKDSVFFNEFNKFKENKAPNDEAIFNFIDEILNKETGVLGKQGIGNLFNDPSLRGDKMAAKRLAFQYIITTARDFVIKKIRYDLKKNIERVNGKFKDTNFLGGLKQQIPDESKIKVETVQKWITTNIFVAMQNFVKTIREEDIKAAMAKGGVAESGETYTTYGLKSWDEAKDKQVYYKRDGWDENKKDEEQGNLIATGTVKEVNDAAGELTIHNDKINQDIVKKFDQVISKEIGDKVSQTKVAGATGGDEQKLKDSLVKIKTDPAKLGQVLKYTDFIQNPENADKITQINNIINQ